MRTWWAWSRASPTIRSASSFAAWTTASFATSRACSPRARSTSDSASRRALASSSSRSRTTHRACLTSSGRASRISATISSISSRFSKAEDDSGMDLASRTRSSSCWIRAARSIPLPSLPRGLELLGQALCDHRGDEPLHVPAQPGEVVHGPEPLHDGHGPLPAGEVHQEPRERRHLDPGERRRGLLEQADAVLHGEQRRLGGVLEHAHHQTVEQAAGALDDVQMSVRHGVECPRTQGHKAHQTSRYRTTRLSPYSSCLAIAKCTGMTTLEDFRGLVRTTVHPGESHFSPSSASSRSICSTGVA